MNKEPNLEEMLRRINVRLSELKLSERQASINATGRPDAIRYIRTRGNWPSAHRVAQLAKALKTTPTYLLGIDPVPDVPLNLEDESRWIVDGNHNLATFGGDTDKNDAIPIYATVKQILLRSFEQPDDPFSEIGAELLDRMEEVNFVKTPPLLRGRDIYGVYRGNGLQVELILVDPRQSPQAGDVAVIFLNQSVTTEPVDLGEPVLFRAVDRAPLGRFRLLGRPTTIPDSLIARVHRVLPLREILGA